MKRVVVTGLGAITPIGVGVDNFWNGIKEGKVGIKTIDRFDVTDYKAKVAGQIDDFNPGDYMDVKAAKRMELFSQYAVAATKEAIEDSGIDMEKEQYSKLVSDIPEPNIAISMGCNVSCPFIGRPFDDNWGLEDPTGKSDEEYKIIIREIEDKILTLRDVCKRGE